MGYRSSVMSENPLKRIMNPGSIAVLGANNNPQKMGTMQTLSIIKDGYKGKIYPIHPKEKEVLGFKAYASVEELPEAPDLAFFVIPVQQVLPLMEDFGKKGTRHAIVITAGFREAGADGVRMEAGLNEIAHKYGIRYIGPNCMGVINTELPLNTTVAAIQTEPGMLGMASQSGTYVAQTIPYLAKRGIRLSKSLSLGNEANITMVDALDYLGDDEQTKAIALYIEGIRDVPRFLEVARRVTRKKPVVAQYIGGTEAGARAGMSHTGAMAGPDFLYEGLFNQAGIIRLHSIEDLFDHGWALASQPRLKGPRLGILTNSGGPGSAIANECDKGGFSMPVFSEKLQAAIRPLIQPHAPCGNPVDLTFSMDMSLLSDTLPEMVMQSGEVDGIVIHGVMSTGFMSAIYPHLAELMGNIPLESMIEMMKPDTTKTVTLPFKYGIPVAISSFFGREDHYTVAFHKHGIPVLDSPEKAARVMVSMLRYHAISTREPYKAPVLPPVNAEASRILAQAKSSGRKTLDEYEAKSLLACYGIPVTDDRLAATEKEIERAADELGYPLVLKACDPEILHKTERGLVHLGLKNREDAVSAFHAIQESAGRAVPVIACRMVKGARELVSGFTRHTGFGPCVLFGLGGIYTEALRDAVFRIAPVTLYEAREMLGGIRASRILREFRGMPEADLEALARLVKTLGDIAVLHPEIAEIDTNPIIIQGSSPVVVDALVALEKN